MTEEHPPTGKFIPVEALEELIAEWDDYRESVLEKTESDDIRALAVCEAYNRCLADLERLIEEET